jgi:hypothetical protein
VSQLVLPLLPLLLALLLWLVTLLLAVAAAVVESTGKLVAETAADAVVVVETVWWLSGRVQLETAVDEAAVVAVVDKESTCRSIVSLSYTSERRQEYRNKTAEEREVFEFVHSGNEASKICPVVSVTNRTVPPTL